MYVDAVTPFDVLRELETRFQDGTPFIPMEVAHYGHRACTLGCTVIRFLYDKILGQCASPYPAMPKVATVPKWHHSPALFLGV